MDLSIEQTKRARDLMKSKDNYSYQIRRTLEFIIADAKQKRRNGRTKKKERKILRKVLGRGKRKDCTGKKNKIRKIE